MDKLISAGKLLDAMCSDCTLRQMCADSGSLCRDVDLIKKCIEEAHAVDAAAIVLCKDCEYATIYEVNNTLECCDYFDSCGYVGKEHEGNGCTYGRKNT